MNTEQNQLKQTILFFSLIQKQINIDSIFFSIDYFLMTGSILTAQPYCRHALDAFLYTKNWK